MWSKIKPQFLKILLPFSLYVCYHAFMYIFYFWDISNHHPNKLSKVRIKLQILKMFSHTYPNCMRVLYVTITPQYSKRIPWNSPWIIFLRISIALFKGKILWWALKYIIETSSKILVGCMDICLYWKIISNFVGS